MLKDRGVRLAVALLACAGFLTVGSERAAAEWAGHCTNADHCYAIADWTMIDGESVLADEDQMWDWKMYIAPGSAFVDDETWLTWSNEPGWVESGEEAEPSSCGCNLYPFFAQETNGSKPKYIEYVSPTEVFGETINGYKIASAGGGAWSIYWQLPITSEDKYIATVTGGYASTATELQAGMEAAAETTPINEESTVVGAEYTNDTWHRWEGAYTKAREISEAGTCIHSSPAGGPGSTYNGTICEGD